MAFDLVGFSLSRRQFLMHGPRHWSRQRSQKRAGQCNDVMHSCVWNSRASLGISCCAHVRTPFPLSRVLFS
ncbi:hypothetical protein BaRGS_00009441, partial [Batillaria attramentaria]